MKIRMGFITNSSSTNFLIISKEELTEEYLFQKLGFVKGGALEKQGWNLCADIMYAIQYRGLSHNKYTVPNYDNIKEIFGEKSANIFKERKGYHTYWGYTNSEDEPIISFFTTESFDLEDKDFYIDGKACVW